MSTMQRVTVTLPDELVQEVDREERNRSRFIQIAVERELGRRRQERLRESLNAPHPETEAFADEGLGAWVCEAGADDESLVDLGQGTPLRWDPTTGWKRR